MGVFSIFLEYWFPRTEQWTQYYIDDIHSTQKSESRESSKFGPSVATHLENKTDIENRDI